MTEHDPCLQCRMPANDVSTCGMRVKSCHRQTTIDEICNMISSAGNEPGLEAEGSCVGEIVDAAIRRAFEPDVVSTDRWPQEEHDLRTESDEYVCNKCGKRWGFDDTEIPECG